MPVWEYRIIRLEAQPGQEQTLNALGEDRWELVAIVAQGNQPMAYLKRERAYPSPADPGPWETASTSGQGQPSKSLAQAVVKVSATDDPGVNGWVDTGMDVGEENAGVSFTISGEVMESSGEWVGPEGSSRYMVLNPAIGEELPSGCLVAMVGEGGTIEQVISSGFLATSERGRLYLAINDDSYEHNEGEFTVAVTVM